MERVYSHLSKLNRKRANKDHNFWFKITILVSFLSWWEKFQFTSDRTFLTGLEC